MKQEILCRKQNGIFEIELNRPDKKNALTQAMYQAIIDGLNQAEADDDVRVILIYGQPFCFSAGNDLKDFLENPPLDENATTFVMLRTMAQLEKPVIMAVNGAAVGIGTTMCLHADLVYSGESTRFQLPFVKLGLVPEFASSYLLPRLTGHQKAFELLVLGDPFDAKTAHEVGLVNQVFDDEHYLTAAKQKAVDLALLPANAVLETKKLLRHGVIKNHTMEAMAKESEVFSRLLQSAEAMEKFAAFLNK